MKKKGKHSVFLTGIILFASISLIAGWAWHSIPGYEMSPGNHIVERAYYEEQSGIMVEATGEVVRVLGEKKDDSSMQWFQMRTPSGQRLLVGHDHGLGERIPLNPQDTVTVRGQYEWSETGGTIRQTERDRSLERQHGWVEYDGRKYD
ncbi:MAG: DUF3465 domain-containing protein [Xanthomonadales bacterium]|jgi:hypothetical protein|nr:DUF3465 domain-containing protein [Xanthomonadales bacterium]